MNQRELTFSPETERTRDLIYSEYTSCDRSIHCLLQDNSGPQHRFLLLAYREIVSRYLSGARLQAPREFLQDLTARLDTLSESYHFSLEDYRAMGFHLLLRSTEAFYLLTSRREAVLVHNDGDVVTLSESSPGIERVVIKDHQLQEELFPDRLKDCFNLYRLDSGRYSGCDIILGCGEEDKSTVLEVLGDPLWLRAGERRNTFSSRFITRKVLVLRFDDSVSAARIASRRAVTGGRAWRRGGLALAGGAVVVALVAALVQNEVLSPLKPVERTQAMLEVPVGGTIVHDEGSGGAAQEVADEAPVAQANAFLGTALVERWKKAFSEPVTSSPALSGDAIFFGCRDGNAYALERASGKVLWQVKSSEGVGASPVIHGEAVVLADYGGNVFSVRKSDGKKLWNNKLPARVVSSPVVAGDRLLVGCYDGNAYCLSTEDGRTLWKHGTGGRIRASAAVAGTHFIVASYDGYLYGLAAADGSRAWRYRIGGNISGSPAVYNDVVVIGGPDGTVYAVSGSEGRLLWKFRTSAAVKATPVVADGRVYIGSNDRHVYCLGAEDGSVRWKYRTEGMVLGRPVVRGGVVYVGSYDGYMYCIGAGDGKLVDRFDTDGEIYSSPAADENAVYFGNNKGRFFALGHKVKDTS